MKSYKSQTAKKRKSKLLLILPIFLAVILGEFLFLMNRPAKEVNIEPIILKKLSHESVESRFTPVFIYRVDENVGGFFSGSGSLFIGSNGEQIVTAEHLFRKEFGKTMFAFRKLRPFENEITHSIQKILHKGEELAMNPGDEPDIVILRTGNPELLECYSDLKIGPTPKKMMGVNKLKEKQKVRSLLTGEWVNLVGTTERTPDSKSIYVLIEYASLPGESGSGFVDEDDNLYVLKAIPGWPDNIKALMAKHLGTSKELSMVYGPLKLQK